MKIRNAILVIFPAIIFFSLSCRHEPVLPEQQVSFHDDVMPIIQLGCQHAGCHGDSLNSEFKLVNYDDVMDKCEVEPGKPKHSKLYEVITTDPNSEDFMPRSPYPALNERQIKLIYIWIAQGAKDN